MTAVATAAGPPAVVLDLSPNGLGVVRSLAARGITVYACDTARKVRLGRTRLARCRTCPDPATEPRATVAFLQALALAAERRPVLYTCSDDFVELVSRHRRELARLYRFLLPAEEVVEGVLDKRETYRLAREHGVPCPKTWLVPGGEIDQVLAEVTFPCIIKPARSYRFRRRVNRKAFLIPGRQHLRAEFLRLREHGPLLVQEFIPGDDREIFQAGFLFDGASRLVGRFMGRKLLQYPPTFGSGALTVAESLRDLLELGARWFQAMGCQGLANVEFKRDPRDGAFKLMEPDLRLWLWHDLSRPAGVDLAYLYYRLLAGPPPAPRLEQRDGIKWIYGIRALHTARHHRREGTLTKRELLQLFRGPWHHALFSWRDPLPSLRLTWHQRRPP